MTRTGVLRAVLVVLQAPLLLWAGVMVFAAYASEPCDPPDLDCGGPPQAVVLGSAVLVGLLALCSTVVLAGRTRPAVRLGVPSALIALCVLIMYLTSETAW